MFDFSENDFVKLESGSAQCFHQFDGLTEEEKISKIRKYLEKCPETALWVFYTFMSDEFLVDLLMVAMQNHLKDRKLEIDPYDDRLPIRGM